MNSEELVLIERSLGEALIEQIEESIAEGELSPDMTLEQFVQFLKAELEAL